LVPVAVEALVRHRDRQEVERLTAPRYATHDFVFADGAREPWRAEGVHKYHWLPTLVRLNLPRVRLYDARYSCATMLLESGVPMRVVQEILGHASMVLTADTYSHVTPAFKRQAAPVRHIGEIAVVLAAPDRGLPSPKSIASSSAKMSPKFGPSYRAGATR
jgi:integrase